MEWLKLVFSRWNCRVRAFLCSKRGHNFRFVREIKKGVVEKRCKRCGKVYGFGYGKMVEVTPEIRALHDDIVVEEYFK